VIISTLDLQPRATTTVPLIPAVVPGGRLSLSSTVPAPASDLTGGTIVYVPYLHDQVELFEAKTASWLPYKVPQSPFLSISLGSTAIVAANTAYDVFMYLTASGVPALEVGPAWTSDILRSTDVQYAWGRWVKVGDFSRLLLGTFYTTSTTATADTGAQRYLCNAYNRVPRQMQVVEATASWTYVGGYRQANASLANQVNFLTTVAAEPVEAQVMALVANDATTRFATAAVGLDSTTSAAGSNPKGVNLIASQSMTQLWASFQAYPTVGRHYLAWLERASGAGTVTWYGTGGSALTQAGLIATVYA
jgi:hypothetical protein